VRPFPKDIVHLVTGARKVTPLPWFSSKDEEF
jgi:hypothetical protein